MFIIGGKLKSYLEKYVITSQPNQVNYWFHLIERWILIQMLMFDDMGGGGCWWKDYWLCWHWKGLQKVDMFPLKSMLYHQFSEYKGYVFIYLYISPILYNKIFK